MIQELVQRLAAGGPGGIPAPLPGGAPAAAAAVIQADPFDVVLHMEQVWDAANVYGMVPGPAGPARRNLWATGQFAANVPLTIAPAWDHTGYAFALENTRVVQIMRRVLHSFRSGEALGVPSVATQRWLDNTETLLFGAPNPVPAWLSTSTIRPDPEAIRRNLYWRLLGMDLAFGTDANTPFTYDKSEASNQLFVPRFEELLYELWKAIENLRNTSGANAADDDRIYLLAEQIGFMLRTRRQEQLLAREELAAATALGWLELALSMNSPVVVDLRSQATSPADRLKLIGQRVGLAPHSKANSFFSMARELSVLLRTLEAGYVTGPGLAWLLYLNAPPVGAPALPPGAAPIGEESRRVITEWSAASGRDLKVRKVAAEVQMARRPLAVTADGRRR